MNRLLALAAAAVAGLFLFAGGAAMKWYFWDVVVRQADEPDRSMLFWGLPVVFIGLGALGAAVALAGFAHRELVGRKRSEMT